MTFAAELDDRRQETRRGYASNPLYFWPKVLGSGNVLAASSPAATYEIFEPDGTSITSGTATNTTIDGVTRYSVTVDASSLDLGENYACVFTWTYAGTQYRSTVRFDVVTEPYDGSDVGINDLLDEVAELRELLDGQARAHGGARSVATTAAVAASGVVTWTVAAGHGIVPGNLITASGHDAAFNTSTAVEVTSVTETSVEAAVSGSGTGTSSDTTGAISVARTAEQQASLHAIKAWADVKQWIKSRLESKGRIYPRLILNREEIRGVVTAQAIARAYRAQGGAADSPARQLFDDWSREAQQRLSALGEIDYDSDDNAVADDVLGGFGTVKLARSWT